MKTIEEFIKKIKKSAKAFKDSEEVKGTIYESVITEKLTRGLKPLLTIGSTITKKDGEDALLDLSDKFDSIDDEYAGTIASHLDMAIELMQDGYSGDATKKLKQFNKACKDVLSGKEVGSAFENVNEATYNSKNHIGDTSDGQGSNAEIYKKGKGYYVVVSGEVDYDFTAKNDKELLQKLKDNEFDSTDILEVNEGNFDDILDLVKSLEDSLPSISISSSNKRLYSSSFPKAALLTIALVKPVNSLISFSKSSIDKASNPSSKSSISPTIIASFFKCSSSTWIK